MLPAGTERARSGGCTLLKWSVRMTLAGALCLAVQTAASQAAPETHPPALPNSCLKQSHPSEKITALLESVHDHPTAGAYNTLGVLYAQADRVSCAVSAFQAALKLEAPNWEAHYNLALALLRKADRAGAARELQTAIQQKPDSVSAHFALGTAFEGEKKLAEAEDQLRSTLKIDPHFAPGAIKLSHVLITEGKTAAAVACLEDTIKAVPADQAESVQASLAMAYAENGEMEKALGTLQGLVGAQPESSSAHFNLGLLYARKGQFQDENAAVTEFREALRLDKDMDPARIALGQVLLSRQKYSDAVSVLLDYLRRQPKDAQGFYLLGLANQGLGHSDAAVGALQHAVVLDPRDSAIRFNLGMLLASIGQIDAAIPQLEAAERINPTDLETHNALALLLEKSGYKERARVEKVKVNALKSNREKEAAIASLYDEASHYLAAGKATAAAEDYRKALELNPRDPKLHFNLSLALDKMGDFSSERKELERTLQLDPGVAVAQNHLGLLAFRDGHPEEAERCFTKALAIDPKFAEAQSSLGVLYSQQGKNQEAASLFQKAIKNDPRYTKAYVNLGLLMAQKGAFLEAEHQFRTAIEIDSDDPDAYAAFGMVQAK